MGRKNLQWLHPEPLVAIKHISIIGVNNPTEKYGNLEIGWNTPKSMATLEIAGQCWT
jgi:hypothetical protein